MKAKTILLPIFYLSLTINTVSCKQQKDILPYKDEMLNKYFSKREIKSLNNILYFFDDVVQSKTNKNNLTEAYSEYMQNLKNEYHLKTLNLNISRKKRKLLLKSIDKSLFNKIWIENISITKNDTIKLLDLNNSGSYRNFLKEYSKEDSSIKAYYDSYFNVGCMNAGVISYVCNSQEKFNVNDEKTRLILAINFITLDTHLNK